MTETLLQVLNLGVIHHTHTHTHTHTPHTNTQHTHTQHISFNFTVYIFKRMKQFPSPRILATHLHYDKLPGSIFKNKAKVSVPLLVFQREVLHV